VAQALEMTESAVSATIQPVRHGNAVDAPVPRRVGRDRRIRLDEVKLGMLLRLWMRRDGAYHRVVPNSTVLSEDEGVTLMVPRLPELPPETMVTVCGDRRCKRGTMVTGWLDKKQHEMLIALHEDPQSVAPC
jgi:hypothetical protein